MGSPAYDQFEAWLEARRPRPTRPVASEHERLARALGLITDDPAEAQRRLAAAERLIEARRA